MNTKIQHLRSDDTISEKTPKLPEVGILDYGEIAINYAKGLETISVKNNENEIVTFQNEILVTDTEFTGDEITTAKIVIDDSNENEGGVDIYTKTEVNNLFNALPKMVTLTKDAYDQLQTKDPNTYYFTIEEE